MIRNCYSAFMMAAGTVTKPDQRCHCCTSRLRICKSHTGGATRWLVQQGNPCLWLWLISFFFLFSPCLHVSNSGAGGFEGTSGLRGAGVSPRDRTGLRCQPVRPPPPSRFHTHPVTAWLGPRSDWAQIGGYFPRRGQQSLPPRSSTTIRQTLRQN